MIYRVISLRGLWPHRVPELFIYVGRAWAGLPAHELANPFAGDGALSRFATWFHALPDLYRRLKTLRADTECGRHPLACWCGTWRPGEPALACHAFLIAEEMNKRFPMDLEGSEW